MNIKTHYLTRNKTSGIYYVRLDIPSDLRQHFGIKTIKRSLRTHNKFQASILCLRITAHYKTTFATLRGMPKLDTNNLTHLITVKSGGNEAVFDTGDSELDNKFADKWMEKHGQSQTASHSTNAENLPISTPVKEIIEDFLREKNQTQAWTEKTLGENESIFRLFLRIVGEDLTSAQVDFALARSYKSTLVQLPSNMNKKPEFRELSIQQIIARKPKPMAIGTINKQLTRVSSLMDWAYRHGLVNQNYFAGLGLKSGEKAAKQRDPFTQDDIDKIFNYRGNKLKRKYHYWLPILGYYTGARINELCQLAISDITKDDGIWCFNISDENDGQQVKCSTTIRKTPLHKNLIRLGFLDYIDQLKQKKHIRVFPELTQSRDGYAKNASRWFSELVQKELKLTGKKSFHSFRHTVVEYLKKARIEHPIIAGVVGHYDDSVTTGRYGTGHYPLDILQETVNKIPPHKQDI